MHSPNPYGQGVNQGVNNAVNYQFKRKPECHGSPHKAGQQHSSAMPTTTSNGMRCRQANVPGNLMRQPAPSMSTPPAQEARTIKCIKEVSTSTSYSQATTEQINDFFKTNDYVELSSNAEFLKAFECLNVSPLPEQKRVTRTVTHSTIIEYGASPSPNREPSATPLQTHSKRGSSSESGSKINTGRQVHPSLR